MHLTLENRKWGVIGKVYVNLRYANFTASAVYQWKPEEARKLIQHRYRIIERGATLVGLDNPAQYPVPGFYEEGNMPCGHVVLESMLWGKWRTVWVRAPVILGLGWISRLR
jgi:hypothetical protein